MSVSRGRIVLIGCLAALGAAVVVVLVGWFLLSTWIHQPAPPLDGTRLADDSTAAYLEVSLRPEDAAARDLARELLKATRDTSDLPGEVPHWLRGVLARAGARPPTDKEINRLLPLRLVGTISSAPGNGFAPPLLAINAEGAGRAFRFMDTMLSLAARRDTDLLRIDHQGTSIYRMPLESHQVWIAVAGTDLIASQEEAAVRHGLDRLRPGAGEGPAWIRDALSAMPPDAVLRVLTAEGRTSSLGGLISEGAAEWRAMLAPALDSTGPLSLWARLQDAETIRGEVRLRDRAARPDDSSFELTLPLAGGPLQISLRPRPAEGVWEIEVRGVGTGLGSALRRLRKAMPQGVVLTGR